MCRFWALPCKFWASCCGAVVLCTSLCNPLLGVRVCVSTARAFASHRGWVACRGPCCAKLIAHSALRCCGHCSNSLLFVQICLFRFLGSDVFVQIRRFVSSDLFVHMRFFRFDSSDLLRVVSSQRLAHAPVVTLNQCIRVCAIILFLSRIVWSGSWSCSRKSSHGAHARSNVLLCFCFLLRALGVVMHLFAQNSFSDLFVQICLLIVAQSLFVCFRLHRFVGSLLSPRFACFVCWDLLRFVCSYWLVQLCFAKSCSGFRWTCLFIFDCSDSFAQNAFSDLFARICLLRFVQFGLLRFVSYRFSCSTPIVDSHLWQTPEYFQRHYTSASAVFVTPTPSHCLWRRNTTPDINSTACLPNPNTLLTPLAPVLFATMLLGRKQTCVSWSLFRRKCHAVPDP